MVKSSATAAGKVKSTVNIGNKGQNMKKSGLKKKSAPPAAPPGAGVGREVDIAQQQGEEEASEKRKRERETNNAAGRGYYTNAELAEFVRQQKYRSSRPGFFGKYLNPFPGGGKRRTKRRRRRKTKRTKRRRSSRR